MKRPHPTDLFFDAPQATSRKESLGVGSEFSQEEQREGSPAWIISFADMVLLMMGFFVLLFALNKNPTSRLPGGSAPEGHGAPSQANAELLDLALSIREAFKNPVQPTSTDPEDLELVTRLIQRQADGDVLDSGLFGSSRRVQSIRPSDYYSLSGSVSFEENSDALSEDAYDSIAEFADLAKGMQLVIEIRGHSTALEAAQGNDHAIQLSSQRAMAVAGELAALGIDWWRIRLVLAADHDRIEAHPSDRSTDLSNARVELIMTDQIVPERVATQYDE